MSNDLSPRRRALLERFTTGSLERIDRMQRSLDDMSAGRSNLEALRIFAREMHTLKGEARMMGFGLLGDAALAGEQMVKTEDIPGPSICTALTRLLTAIAGVLREPASEPTAAILKAAIAESSQGSSSWRDPSPRVPLRTATADDGSGPATIPGGFAPSGNPSTAAEAAPTPFAPIVPPPAVQPTRILLVDDSPIVRSLVSDVLIRHGFTVAEAYDGQAALEMIDEVQPDLVLLDLDMPRMNGFQVLTRLRRRPKTAPIVMLTSHSSDEDRAQARQLGAADYMVKADFADEELVGMVRRNLPGGVRA